MKLSLTRFCNFREHWRHYQHVKYVHGVEIYWCSKCRAVALRKLDKNGPKTDYVFKVVHILKELIAKHNLKGKALVSSWLVNYIKRNGGFQHPNTVKNALGWLVMAHKQVMGLSLDGVITIEQGSIIIKDDKPIPVEVYVIKPDIYGDPEYLPLAFECPECSFKIPISDVEYGEKFTCPRCWSWYVWYDTLSEPMHISPPPACHADLNITVDDAETGELVRNAYVTISTEDFPNFKHYALTCENGTVSFNVPRWRKLVVEVKCQGYKAYTIKIIIADTGEDLTLNHLTISLKKLTAWDYVLPIVAAVAVVTAPLIVIGLAEASKGKK